MYTDYERERVVSAKKSFCMNLRSNRTEEKMTQKRLAELSGVSLSTISRIERGVTKTPKDSTVIRVSIALSSLEVAA